MPGQEKEKITVTATLELSHRDRQAISFAAEKLPFPANHAAISAFAEWASHKVLPTVVHLLNKAEAEGEDLPKALLRSAEEDDYERDDPDCPADFDYVDTMANAYLEVAAKLDDRQLQELLLYAAKQMGIPYYPDERTGLQGAVLSALWRDLKDCPAKLFAVVFHVHESDRPKELLEDLDLGEEDMAYLQSLWSPKL